MLNELFCVKGVFLGVNHCCRSTQSTKSLRTGVQQMCGMSCFVLVVRSVEVSRWAVKCSNWVRMGFLSGWLVLSPFSSFGFKNNSTRSQFILMIGSISDILSAVNSSHIIPGRCVDCCWYEASTIITIRDNSLDLKSHFCILIYRVPSCL